MVVDWDLIVCFDRVGGSAADVGASKTLSSEGQTQFGFSGNESGLQPLKVGERGGPTAKEWYRSCESECRALSSAMFSKWEVRAACEWPGEHSARVLMARK